MKIQQDHVVAVLGASANPQRYSNQAVKMLLAYGYTVIPVHPALKELYDLPVAPSLRAIDRPVHTLTLYLSPERSLQLVDDIIALRPQRVILNPGTEDPDLQDRLARASIPYETACTLVLLRTGQFLPDVHDDVDGLFGRR
ncbi:MAG: CoA-binding protein [Spartobacteria bacterium]|nr:CoA-binding protein [Spartobacteria bacterium]